MNRTQHEKGDDQPAGGFSSPPPATVALVIVALLAAVIIFGPVGDDIDRDFEECRASGGEIAAPGQGEVLYCVYENDTGYKLGVETEPSPINA